MGTAVAAALVARLDRMSAAAHALVGMDQVHAPAATVVAVAAIATATAIVAAAMTTDAGLGTVAIAVAAVTAAATAVGTEGIVASVGRHALVRRIAAGRLLSSGRGVVGVCDMT